MNLIPGLNQRAMLKVDTMVSRAAELRIGVSHVDGVRLIDCGAAVPGGLNAGVLLAETCLADLGQVRIVPGEFGMMVQVQTDHPVEACLASQYAGWQISAEKYFAMGSGPMRAAAGREAIFEHVAKKEAADCAVGILETKKPPTSDALVAILAKLPVPADRLTLLYAPAASIAGSIQVVARSVETALHKLHELQFDVSTIVSGYGTAPLPPIAKDELQAIGRTNDAILYGGRVVLWVNTTDEILETIGPKVPSNASKDHGELFAELYKRYGGFYQIDPLLFSPACVTFVNLSTGRAFEFGTVEPGLIQKSFFAR